jgi:hypothetical protein
MPKKKEEKTVKPAEIWNLSKLDTLMKLRIIITSIFALSTVSIILLIVFPSEQLYWVIAALLVLISYVMVFALMVKLLMTKEL